MKSILIQLISLCSVIAGCNIKENNEKTIENSAIVALKRSNDAISELSAKNYEALQNKLIDVTYGDRVEKWNKKAVSLKELTRRIIFDVENSKSHHSHFIDSLKQFKHRYVYELQLLDSNLTKYLLSFLHSEIPTVSEEFIIQKTKNDILLLESVLSDYFNENTAVIIEPFTRFSTIIGQNTNHLRNGETLIISAGIGSFTLAANPVFIINQDSIMPDYNQGVATYKFSVSGRGTKNLPVKIIYTSSEGQKKTEDFQITYTVDN